MTALAAERQRTTEKWRYHTFTLASGFKAWKGAQIGIITSGATAGQVAPMQANRTDMKFIGTAWRTTDATSGAVALFTVRFDRNLELEYLNNDGTIGAAQIGQSCYFSDDQTVTLGASSASGLLGYSPAGVIYGLDSVLGVLVNKNADICGLDYPNVGVLPAPVAGVITVVAVSHDAIYGVPVLAAATTIVLPAPALLPVGLRATFVANGVKNGFAVTYQDATGAVALTAALTASKRHQAIATVTADNVWVVLATVAP